MKVTINTRKPLTFKDLKIGQLFVSKDQLSEKAIVTPGVYIKDETKDEHYKGLCVRPPLDKFNQRVHCYIDAGYRCSFGDDTVVLLVEIEEITISD